MSRENGEQSAIEDVYKGFVNEFLARGISEDEARKLATAYMIDIEENKHDA
jgi:DNA-binding transcriptional regulator YhcF (GntR family)